MRILAIGDTESLAETRRVMARSEFEMYRVPAALAAVRMVRQIPFDLMLVVHPLTDTEFGSFHREIRARSSPCRHSQLLVLASNGHLAELDGFRDDSRLEIVDVDQPQHRLAEAAARYLGPIRAAMRYDLRLPVRWDAAREPSQTIDISTSGALIELDDGERPPVGERLDLTLEPPEGPITLTSEVVRHTAAPADKARGFAVDWVRPGDARVARLEQLLRGRTRARPGLSRRRSLG